LTTILSTRVGFPEFPTVSELMLTRIDSLSRRGDTHVPAGTPDAVRVASAALGRILATWMLGRRSRRIEKVRILLLLSGMFAEGGSALQSLRSHA
jgi:hypothetical protein